MNQSKVFNAEMLADLMELENDGELNLVQELIELFKGEAPTQIATLIESARAGDLRKLEMAAHSMKSSANVLGLEQVGKSCLEIETMARDKTFSPEILAQLQTQLPAAIAELNAYLRSRNLEPK